MIKLVLTDLDDTLIPLGSPHVSEFARAAIHQLIDAGLHFGPVSGRRPQDMEWMFAGDTLCHQTGAYCNGQLVYVDGRLVERVPIAASSLNKLKELVIQDAKSTLLIHDIEDTGEVFHFGSTQKLLDNNPSFTSFFTQVRHSLNKSDYVKVNIQCIDDPEHLIAFKEYLRSELPELDFVFPAKLRPLIDIVPAGWNKGKAVGVIAQTLECTLDEVCVFGDSENDEAMIGSVPHSVAVSNASPELARLARYHIGSAQDEAVAHALIDITQAYSKKSMPAFMA